MNHMVNDAENPTGKRGRVRRVVVAILLGSALCFSWLYYVGYGPDEIWSRVVEIDIHSGRMRIYDYRFFIVCGGEETDTEFSILVKKYVTVEGLPPDWHCDSFFRPGTMRYHPKYHGALAQCRGVAGAITSGRFDEVEKRGFLIDAMRMLKKNDLSAVHDLRDHQARIYKIAWEREKQDSKD